MKFKHYIVLVVFTICFVTTSYSQHQTYLIKNGFGLTAGISQYNIITDNFDTKQGQGWVGGLSATVDIPHKPYTISYGMQLSENYLEISGRELQNVPEMKMIEYKLMAVQMGFTYRIKIFRDNLTIDLGPQLQYNGKLELKDDAQEGYFINGKDYDNITAKDITNISQFNVNGMGGISVGIGFFQVKAQYIYGFLNILDKLNDKSLITGKTPGSFKGNQSMLVFAAMFSF